MQTETKFDPSTVPEQKYFEELSDDDKRLYAQLSTGDETLQLPTSCQPSVDEFKRAARLMKALDTVYDSYNIALEADIENGTDTTDDVKFTATITIHDCTETVELSTIDATERLYDWLTAIKLIMFDAILDYIAIDKSNTDK